MSSSTPSSKGGADQGRHLRDAETLIRLVANLPEGIYIEDGQGRILDANQALLELFGCSSVAELQQHAGNMWADPEQRSERSRRLERDRRLRDFELKVRLPSGDVRTLRDACYALQDSDDGESVHGILIDMTERAQLEAKLRGLAVRDPLTGCYNRRFLTDVEQSIEQSTVHWGVIVLDIDGFKRINDEHGHAKGDEILKRLARFIMRQLRADDAVVRLGGDEFLALLFDEDTDYIEHVVERFRHSALSEAPVAFSLGWAVRESGETLAQTIYRADRQLIHVKVQARDYPQRRRSGPYPGSPQD